MNIGSISFLCVLQVNGVYMFFLVEGMEKEKKTEMQGKTLNRIQSRRERKIALQQDVSISPPSLYPLSSL